MLVDATEVTRKGAGRGRSRLRRFLSAHPNVVTWVLPLAAFLFGVTLSAAGFVGIWRHTASEADRAHATANGAAQRLSQALRQVRGLKGEVREAHLGLAAARSALARARSKELALAKKLAAAKEATNLLADRLPSQLAAVDAATGAVARRSSSLASALSGLQSYLAHGGSSVDPGFVKLQVQYVIRASARVQASTAELERRVGAAVDAASRVSNPR